MARYEHGPFGEPLGESGEADACPFRWQTKWYDSASEQYYFGYRHYSPRHGRWLSRDPLGEEGGFNLYGYCGNDPINRHDPFGLADVLGDNPHEFDVSIRLDGSYAVHGNQRIVQTGPGLLNAFNEVPGPAQRAIINFGLTGNAKYLDEPLLKNAAENGMLPFLVFSANDPQAASESLAGIFAGFLGGGRAPIFGPRPTTFGNSVTRRSMGWRLPSRSSESLVLHRDQIIMNNYQRYYNDAWIRTVAELNAGRIPFSTGQNWRTVAGQYTDAAARFRMRNFLAREGIAEGPGTDVLVNRWLRDPTGSGAYRIPDLRLMETRNILDGTIGNKTLTMPQAVDFNNFSGGFDILFVRPTVGPIP